MTLDPRVHSSPRIRMSANLLEPCLDPASQAESTACLSWYAMSPDLLEHYIKSYIEQQHHHEIEFVWQGEEPTLLGLAYFKDVVRLQQQYRPPGAVIVNHLQTDATQITQQWAQFLAAHGFFVQVQINGPIRQHASPSVPDKALALAIEGVALLRHYQVVFSTVSEVNRESAEAPLTLYHFLRDTLGSTQMHFVPVVKQAQARSNPSRSFPFAQCEAMQSPTDPLMTPDSLLPGQWGNFLCTLFDEWFYHDLGNVNLPYVAACVETWMGQASPLCTLSSSCGNNLSLTRNGDVFSCQQYQKPEYKLGNIARQSLSQMQTGSQQKLFSLAKEAGLPHQCRQCQYLFTCFGECPKRRILQTFEGETGLNYLCRGWHQFFSHIDHQVSLIIKAMGYQVIKKIQPARYQGKK
ncbi:SPASM domain-containing protein [Motilimonas pumila]|uniref:SPASM domain-containing protein n=1 Tax=Motilimonas pumila TaxID=2303987 RepID=A0A418YB52_9GAMM|nr:SPASM domain-containing protein [Motilimonas pumila]RJG40199.1 SPASM domain-containing protein [Motilimonas pumila]